MARRRLDWIDAVALDPRVPAQAFRLAHVLQSRFVNRKTGEAWPSQTTLADMLKVSERQVRYHLDHLVERGWLERKRGGRGNTNRYVLTGNGTSGQKSDMSG